MVAVSSIKSIQRVSANIANLASSNTITITAVDTTKAVLIPLGWVGSAATDPVQLTLTNSTTITGGRVGTAGQISFAAEVVEYY